MKSTKESFFIVIPDEELNKIIGGDAIPTPEPPKPPPRPRPYPPYGYC